MMNFNPITMNTIINVWSCSHRHHHHLAVKESGHLLDRSSLIHPEVSLNVILGFLLHVVCDFLIVWEVCLFPFCWHAEWSLFYISKFCSI
jgi:hypothetical protein